MSVYTPTTEEIREFIEAADRVIAGMVSGASAVEAFDRWLAAHDAGVREDEATRWAQAVIVSGKQGERIGAARAGLEVSDA